MAPAELRDLIVASLDDRKGRSILALDVTKLTDVTDFMVLASGTSARHVRALVDSLRETARRCAVHVLGVEGEDTGTWVLVDLGDVVVHVMQAETRAFYDLERLWGEAGEVRGQAGEVRGEAGEAGERREGGEAGESRARPSATGRSPDVKVRVLAVGTRQPRWVNEGFSDYVRACRAGPASSSNRSPRLRARPAAGAGAKRRPPGCSAASARASAWWRSTPAGQALSTERFAASSGNGAWTAATSRS